MSTVMAVGLRMSNLQHDPPQGPLWLAGSMRLASLTEGWQWTGSCVHVSATAELRQSNTHCVLVLRPNPSDQHPSHPGLETHHCHLPLPLSLHLSPLLYLSVGLLDAADFSACPGNLSNDIPSRSIGGCMRLLYHHPPLHGQLP